MPQARELPFGLRFAVGAIGVVLLLLAGLCAFALYEGPWSWWVASFGMLAFMEGIDFLVAAQRRGGGWPTPAFILVEFLTPW